MIDSATRNTTPLAARRGGPRGPRRLRLDRPEAGLRIPPRLRRRRGPGTGGSSVFWCEHPGICGPSYWARAVFPGIRTYPRKIRTGNQQLPTRRRRKPWRYRWPDDFRDEVLARLLELNRQRAEEERLSGAAAEAGRGKPRKKSTAGRKAARKNLDQPEFFES